MNAHIIGRFSNGSLLTLSNDERRRHIYLSGKTGTGKSTLLFNLMMDDFRTGRGFALLDPNGDLALQIADSTPPSRTNDVLYLDPTDVTHSFGFNPLEHERDDKRFLTAAHIVSAFKNLYGESWGPRLEYILTNSIRLLLDTKGSTLLGIPLLLTDSSYRTRLLKKCADPVVRFFWEREFEGYTDRMRVEAISPIQNKIGQFASNPILRAIIGQPKSTLDISYIMNNRKILIANLSKGKLGEEPAHLLGALLTTAFSQAAEGRADTPEPERQDFTLYVDEFQNFATDSFAAILSEARKWRLNLVLANQFLAQVPDLLRQAVIGNVGTLVVFRVGSEDSQLLSAELGLHNFQAVTDTPNYAAWVKFLHDNSPSEAYQITTLPSATTTTGSLHSVAERTRARHARPRPIVEDGIARLFS